ncbi:ABC transporter ATP-binding protein/permease [Candidatus Saccharibacteria bacterium]|nr:ABC transporter ATP-binding protein/permease [Candidatus Saccharibacteria bacterium]
MLEVKNVTKVYETGGLKHKALSKVSVNFRTNEFVAVLGPSGSGKTTLLNIIGGLDHYTSGDLKINEISTKKYRDKDWDSYRNHRIGFVFQSYNLIPHQTILENVMLAMTLSGVGKSESKKRAKQALTDVGLADQINKKPAQLSGGQMQRVAIARALVNNPDILLADEPTGALDSDTSVQIMNLLKEIARDKLVIMVTHNPELAEAYATRIITLKDGVITADSDPYDGKIKTNLKQEDAKSKSKKTRMSFFTALSLSLRNLLTKKGRTLLVSFAGSIGIIGIALILSVSTGFQSYIDKIEHDALTSYPLALMKESTNITGILLNFTGGNGGAPDDGKVHENQVIAGSLANVTENDLDSFIKYYDAHAGDLKNDVRLMEYEYNIDPMIYTVDAAGKLAQLNPSSIFSTLLGSNSLLNSYSSLTSVFQQYDIENMKNDTEILAGRYPENYNEMVVFLSSPGQISDFLTYSLGFHDTAELNKIIASIMGGENVEINAAPLTLSYDDLLNVDLRLIAATDTYKFNEKYDVYEDMTGDIEYMQNLYDNKSEKLKIVGVVTSSSELAGGSGVLYLPSLTTHIIEKAGETEIVQKQLTNPTVDIFSNTKFGEKENSFNFEFSDLVSVDNAALSQAFNVVIDQTAVTNKTTEYMNEIADDITADIQPVEDALTGRLDTLKDGLYEKIAGLDGAGTFKKNEISKLVAEFVAAESFEDLTAEYLIPAENFSSMYQGVLSGLLNAYVAAYGTSFEAQTGMPFDPETMEVPMVKIIYGATYDQYIKATEVMAVFEKFSIMITELLMKSEILPKVGELTAYLSCSFADAFSIDETALLSAFKLNFTEEELSRVVTAMFNESEATLNTNLALLGYQALDDPKEIAFYFSTFDGKTNFMNFIDNYNDKMRDTGQESKVIEYSDTTGALLSSVKVIVDAVSYVLIAFVSISLIVSSIMIGIITYISVYERTKEIGILRAIGASKRNISNIFNAETFIVGLLAGLIGILISYLLLPPINAVLHAFTGDIPLSATLLPLPALVLIILSVILTLIGGLIPAKAASKRDPVEALRSE